MFLAWVEDCDDLHMGAAHLAGFLSYLSISTFFSKSSSGVYVSLNPQHDMTYADY